jgi:rare lipoprotein A
MAIKSELRPMKRWVIYMIMLLCMGLSASAQSKLLLRKNTSASIYAKRFHGRKTASGERFNHDSLTAAHKYLRFGQLLMVQNLANDCTVIVKVNDRLAKRSRHSIDLTLAAAKKLGFHKHGVARVRIWHYFPPSENDTIPIP